LTLLLKYGANVNAIARPSNGKNQYLKTPLIAASTGNITSVKILVENGADLNFYNELVFRNAIDAACPTQNIEIIKYLVIDNNADFSKPLLIDSNGDTLFLHHYLRGFYFKLGSKEHKLKMEVVEYLKKKGMNYWETEVPHHLYKVYSQEYLEKY
tara:strand:+ start:1659 stop:2123 length:465 start_codon:yes stop_codon:yes gene_type:complete